MAHPDAVELFTDGACSGNPGPGGWGVLMCWRGHERALNGGASETTNNRMELQAAIEGLSALKRPMQVVVYTDSTYVKQGITDWINGWQRRGWRTSSGAPVKNADLWQALLAATAPHTVEWQWVKGHAGHWGNERADALAREGIPARR